MFKNTQKTKQTNRHVQKTPKKQTCTKIPKKQTNRHVKNILAKNQTNEQLKYIHIHVKISSMINAYAKIFIFLTILFSTNVLFYFNFSMCQICHFNNRFFFIVCQQCKSSLKTLQC